MIYSSEVIALIEEHGYVEAFKIFQELKRERESIQGEGEEMPWDVLKQKKEQEQPQ